MARFSRLEVLNAVVNTGLVPVFYDPDPGIARQVAQATCGGGARLFEFTNRGDMAVEVFKDLSGYLHREAPDVILGAGSIVDEATAAMYVAYGANFVVGPVLNEAVAKFCNRRMIPYMPGCGSASEISYAQELGAEICKVFPGDSVGGPNFVKAVLGPCPWTRIMPTGGVEATQESINAWFKAGVAAVGIGTHLMKREWIAAGNYQAISQKTAEVLSLIRRARGQSLFLGIDHPGLYPYYGHGAQEIASWYAEVFGFKVAEWPASYFVEGTGAGRIEVVKEGDTDRCHIAVRVADFDAAVGELQGRGIALEEPKLGPDVKSVFLSQPDPAGNRVHLLWRR